MSSESLISLYHSAFIICAAFAVVFLVLSVILFFVFKIPETFNAITGRTRKKAIEEMSARNSNTGRLLPRSAIPGETSSSLSLSTKLTNINSNIQSNTTLMSGGASLGPINASVPAYRQDNRIDPAPVSMAPNSDFLEAGNDQTTLLKTVNLSNTPRPEPEKPKTEIVAPKAEPTDKYTKAAEPEAPKVDVTSNSVIGISSSPVEYDIGMEETSRLTPDMLNPSGKKTEIGRFVIIDERLLIHTDEVIE